MKMKPLGRTGLSVSEICLGTMTWGTQNSEDEAHEQMDYAVTTGVNFFDTAEMYPTTPLSTQTQGRTEAYIGTWFERTGRRKDIILATKIVGNGFSGIRNGAPIGPDTIKSAIEGSLKRLKSDYIDLYQLHWPNRGSYHFRRNWHFDPTGQDKMRTIDDIHVTLEALDAYVRNGTIRAIGLSNESAWGTAQFLRLAEQHDLPRIASIQNEYSLICRHYDLDLAELSHHEDVGLLAYSPLAAGLLTGKYQNGVIPEGSRRSIGPELGGRYTPHVEPAIDAYLQVAARHGLDPTQMAIAFCLTRPFMTSAIIGATSMDQLKTVISAKDVTLSQDVLSDIDKARRRFPMPI